jgi:hypothetical protein
MKWRQGQVRPTPVAPPVVVDVPLGRERLLRVQRFDDALRLLSGTRLQRAATETVFVGGSVLVPITALNEVVKTLRRVARRR